MRSFPNFRIKDIGKVWGAIGRLVKCDGDLKFPILSKVAKAVLTIPHSNADSERIFSIDKKNKIQQVFH